MTRRNVFFGMLAAALSTLWKSSTISSAAAPAKSIDAMQQNWRALLADGVKVPLASEPLKLSKDEWRKRLTPEQFQILREEGTERPGSSPLNGEKRPGRVRLRRLRPAAIYLGDEIRERHRLAKFFHDDSGRLRHNHRLQIDSVRAPNTTASAAAAITATFLTTARNRRASASATTASRLKFIPKSAKAAT